MAAYQLTGNERAKEAAVMAAEQLISRFQEKGGFIQAWGLSLIHIYHIFGPGLFKQVYPGSGVKVFRFEQGNEDVYKRQISDSVLHRFKANNILLLNMSCLLYTSRCV